MINIAIDGPAGAGKTTIAKKLAAQLDFLYIDTGAMFRAYAYICKLNNINIYEDNYNDFIKNIKLDIKLIDGEQCIFYLDKLIIPNFLRTEEISANASYISKNSLLRNILLELQRDLANKNNVVMEGRDITSVVLPNADIKIYLDADIKERTNRRLKDLNNSIPFNELKKEIQDRDYQDMNRLQAPLKRVFDAIYIDSTKLTIKEVLEKILKIYTEKTCDNFCSIELNEIIYEDKMKNIDFLSKINNFQYRVNKTKQAYNDEDINTQLNEFKNKKLILDYKLINNFNYPQEFLDIFENLIGINNNEYIIKNGLFDRGYMEYTYRQVINKDLFVIPEFYIVNKDFSLPIIVKDNNIIRNFNYNEPEFYKSLNFNKFNDNILLIGCDLGYFEYLLNKNSNIKKLYIYDSNKDLFNFIFDNILSKLNLTYEIQFVENLNNLEYYNYNIISPILSEVEKFNIFFNNKLFNYNIYTDEYDLLVNKVKQLSRDVIMSGKDECTNAIIEAYKETKGLCSELTGIELEITEKIDDYLKENNLYFTNYKTYQRFLNKLNIKDFL